MYFAIKIYYCYSSIFSYYIRGHSLEISDIQTPSTYTLYTRNKRDAEHLHSKHLITVKTYVNSPSPEISTGNPIKNVFHAVSADKSQESFLLMMHIDYKIVILFFS